MRYCTTHADLAHLVERDLAKVEVAGSSPVIRSKRKKRAPIRVLFFRFAPLTGAKKPLGGGASHRLFRPFRAKWTSTRNPHETFPQPIRAAFLYFCVGSRGRKTPRRKAGREVACDCLSGAFAPDGRAPVIRLLPPFLTKDGQQLPQLYQQTECHPLPFEAFSRFSSSFLYIFICANAFFKTFFIKYKKGLDKVLQV